VSEDVPDYTNLKDEEEGADSVCSVSVRIDEYREKLLTHLEI
jgi:hypothetical protein